MCKLACTKSIKIQKWHQKTFFLFYIKINNYPSSYCPNPSKKPYNFLLFILFCIPHNKMKKQEYSFNVNNPRQYSWYWNLCNGGSFILKYFLSLQYPSMYLVLLPMFFVVIWKANALSRSLCLVNCTQEVNIKISPSLRDPL